MKDTQSESELSAKREAAAIPTHRETPLHADEFEAMFRERMKAFSPAHNDFFDKRKGCQHSVDASLSEWLELTPNDELPPIEDGFFHALENILNQENNDVRTADMSTMNAMDPWVGEAFLMSRDRWFGEFDYAVRKSPLVDRQIRAGFSSLPAGKQLHYLSAFSDNTHSYNSRFLEELRNTFTETAESLTASHEAGPQQETASMPDLALFDTTSEECVARIEAITGMMVEWATRGRTEEALLFQSLLMDQAQTQNAYVRIKAKYALDLIDRTLVHKASFGSRFNDRMITFESQDAETPSDLVYAHRVLPSTRGTRAVQDVRLIARDTLGAFTKNGSLHALANVPHEPAPVPDHSPDGAAVAYASYLAGGVAKEALPFIYTKVISKDGGAEGLRRMFPQLTEDRAKKLAQSFIDAAPEGSVSPEHTDDALKIKDQEALKAASTAIEDMTRNLEEITQKSKNDQGLRRLLAAYHFAIRSGQHAPDVFFSFVRGLVNSSRGSETTERILQPISTLIFEFEMNRSDLLKTRPHRDSIDASPEYRTIVDTLGDDEAVAAAIRSYLQEVEKKFVYTEVDFVPIANGRNDRITGLDQNARVLVDSHRPTMRKAIESASGLQLSTLSLREQSQFLQFLMRTKQQDAERVFSVVRKHGVASARSFLACEHGAKYGEAVVHIAESLPEDEANAVFQRFSEIVDSIDVETEKLTEGFSDKEDAKCFDREALNAQLLSRAKDILTAFAARAASGPELRDSTDSFTETLERFKKETIVFCSLFKVASKDKKLRFEDVKGLELRDRLPNEISPDEQQQMLKVIEANYAKQRPDLYPLATGKLNELIASGTKETNFSLLKKDGKVAAFLRLDELPDGSMHFGSFNVTSSLHGSAIGETMMRSVLDRTAQEHVIHAEMVPELLAGTAYVESFGFVITGVEQMPLGDEKGTTVPMITIRREDAKNSAFRLKGKETTKKSLIERVGDGTVMRFDVRKQTSDLVTTIEAQAAKGRVATRFFSDETDPFIRYVAFEDDVAVSPDTMAA